MQLHRYYFWSVALHCGSNHWVRISLTDHEVETDGDCHYRRHSTTVDKSGDWNVIEPSATEVVMMLCPVDNPRCPSISLCMHVLPRTFMPGSSASAFCQVCLFGCRLEQRHGASAHSPQKEQGRLCLPTPKMSRLALPRTCCGPSECPRPPTLPCRQQRPVPRRVVPCRRHHLSLWAPRHPPRPRVHRAGGPRSPLRHQAPQQTLRPRVHLGRCRVLGSPLRIRRCLPGQHCRRQNHERLQRPPPRPHPSSRPFRITTPCSLAAF